MTNQTSSRPPRLFLAVAAMLLVVGGSAALWANRSADTQVGVADSSFQPGDPRGGDHMIFLDGHLLGSWVDGGWTNQTPSEDTPEFLTLRSANGEQRTDLKLELYDIDCSTFTDRKLRLVDHEDSIFDEITVSAEGWDIAPREASTFALSVDDEAAVRAELSARGVPAGPLDVTEQLGLGVDLDGDGTNERIILDSGGDWDVPIDAGTYGLVLIESEGAYTALLSKPVDGDRAPVETYREPALFDLNGDGTLEIVLTVATPDSNLQMAYVFDLTTGLGGPTFVMGCPA